jgi:hypothetical protein
LTRARRRLDRAQVKSLELAAFFRGAESFLVAPGRFAFSIWRQAGVPPARRKETVVVEQV